MEFRGEVKLITATDVDRIKAKFPDTKVQAGSFYAIKRSNK
jgi:hypothetical protein